MKKPLPFIWKHSCENWVIVIFIYGNPCFKWFQWCDLNIVRLISVPVMVILRRCVRLSNDICTYIALMIRYIHRLHGDSVIRTIRGTFYWIKFMQKRLMESNGEMSTYHNFRTPVCFLLCLHILPIAKVSCKYCTQDNTSKHQISRRTLFFMSRKSPQWELVGSYRIANQIVGK